MADASEILELQRTRHAMDAANADVLLPSQSCLRDRALELSSLVEHLARAPDGVVPVGLAGDVLVAAVGAATGEGDEFRSLSDAVGRLSEACERIDHLEDFVDRVREATVEVVRLAVNASPGVSMTRFAVEWMETNTPKAACP